MSDFDPGNNLHFGCTGQYLASTAMPLAYDSAGLSTSDEILSGGSSTIQHFNAREFNAWSRTSTVYSALSLNVNVLRTGPDPARGVGSACVSYSLDSGATWTSLGCGATIAQKTVTASLSPTQDLSTISVAVCTRYQQSNPNLPSSFETMDVYDIWTVGTIGGGGGGAGSGSSAGQRKSPVIVN